MPFKSSLYENTVLVRLLLKMGNGKWTSLTQGFLAPEVLFNTWPQPLIPHLGVWVEPEVTSG